VANNRFATPPFVANFFQVPQLSITAFNVVAGSSFTALRRWPIQVHQQLFRLSLLLFEFSDFGSLSTPGTTTAFLELFRFEVSASSLAARRISLMISAIT